MKKIVLFYLVVLFANLSAEEKEEFGLFEKYYKDKSIFSYLNFRSDKNILYVGSISSAQDLEFSFKGYLKYQIMKYYCMHDYIATMSDKYEDHNSFYVCSNKEEDVYTKIAAFKKLKHAPIESLGEDLKHGGFVISHPSEDIRVNEQTLSLSLKTFIDLKRDNQLDYLVFITCTKLGTSDIDPMQLGYIADKKIKNSEYGLFLIEGYLLKVLPVLVQKNSKIPEIFPTKEEIDKAKIYLKM